MELDIYKFELQNFNVAKKAARRLQEKGVKFRLLGLSIVVLADRFTRTDLTNVMANLGAHTVGASDYDIYKLMERL
jgi:arsenate reductase-like glutaredoxin family protein